eukprot:m.187406 g.187406  ORF g.187406 m.187406 type:complete len:920 (-) comp17520_c0_seq2:289-3048(-)
MASLQRVVAVVSLSPQDSSVASVLKRVKAVAAADFGTDGRPHLRAIALPCSSPVAEIANIFRQHQCACCNEDGCVPGASSTTNDQASHANINHNNLNSINSNVQTDALAHQLHALLDRIAAGAAASAPCFADLIWVGDTLDLQQTSSLPLYGALRRAAQGGVRLLRLVNDSSPADVAQSPALRPLPFALLQMSMLPQVLNAAECGRVSLSLLQASTDAQTKALTAALGQASLERLPQRGTENTDAHSPSAAGCSWLQQGAFARLMVRAVLRSADCPAMCRLPPVARLRLPEPQSNANANANANTAAASTDDGGSSGNRKQPLSPPSLYDVLVGAAGPQPATAQPLALVAFWALDTAKHNAQRATYGEWMRSLGNKGSPNSASAATTAAAAGAYGGLVLLTPSPQAPNCLIVEPVRVSRAFFPIGAALSTVNPSEHACLASNEWHRAVARLPRENNHNAAASTRTAHSHAQAARSTSDGDGENGPSPSDDNSQVANDSDGPKRQQTADLQALFAEACAVPARLLAESGAAAHPSSSSQGNGTTNSALNSEAQEAGPNGAVRRWLRHQAVFAWLPQSCERPAPRKRKEGSVDQLLAAVKRVPRAAKRPATGAGRPGGAVPVQAVLQKFGVSVSSGAGSEQAGAGDAWRKWTRHASLDSVATDTESARMSSSPVPTAANLNLSSEGQGPPAEPEFRGEEQPSWRDLRDRLSAEQFEQAVQTRTHGVHYCVDDRQMREDANIQQIVRSVVRVDTRSAVVLPREPSDDPQQQQEQHQQHHQQHELQMMPSQPLSQRPTTRKQDLLDGARPRLQQQPSATSAPKASASSTAAAADGGGGVSASTVKQRLSELARAKVKDMCPDEPRETQKLVYQLLYKVCAAHMSIVQAHRLSAAALEAKLQSLLAENADQALRNVRAAHNPPAT